MERLENARLNLAASREVGVIYGEPQDGQDARYWRRERDRYERKLENLERNAEKV